MISVIMTSYLGHYEGARKDPESKFLRAVKSFMLQDIGSEHCELIIVSDGCEITNRLYLEHFDQVSNITLIKQHKSKNKYPGEYRQIGIDYAKFDIITYLDADDYIMPTRLTSCVQALQLSKRIAVLDSIYNIPRDRTKKISNPIENFEYLGVIFDKIEVRWDSGTFQFVHLKDIDVKWSGRESRGEDHIFFKQLKEKYNLKPDQIRTRIDGYLVCHHPIFGFDV